MHFCSQENPLHLYSITPCLLLRLCQKWSFPRIQTLRWSVPCKDWSRTFLRINSCGGVKEIGVSRGKNSHIKLSASHPTGAGIMLLNWPTYIPLTPIKRPLDMDFCPLLPFRQSGLTLWWYSSLRPVSRNRLLCAECSVMKEGIWDRPQYSLKIWFCLFLIPLSLTSSNTDSLHT